MAWMADNDEFCEDAIKSLGTPDPFSLVALAQYGQLEMYNRGYCEMVDSAKNFINDNFRR